MNAKTIKDHIGERSRWDSWSHSRFRRAQALSCVSWYPLRTQRGSVPATANHEDDCRGDAQASKEARGGQA